MAVPLRQKLLTSLQSDDIDWYLSIVNDNRKALDNFIDVKGFNFFHDIANSILPQKRLKDFFLSITNIFQNGPYLLTEYLNGFAKLDDEEYTPLHLAIVKRKKVFTN